MPGSLWHYGGNWGAGDRTYFHIFHILLWRKHRIKQIYLRGKSRVFGRYKAGSWRSRGPDLAGPLQIRQPAGTHIRIWWCGVAKQVMDQDLGMSVV